MKKLDLHGKRHDSVETEEFLTQHVVQKTLKHHYGYEAVTDEIDQHGLLVP